jgi:hypothetical protein
VTVIPFVVAPLLVLPLQVAIDSFARAFGRILLRVFVSRTHFIPALE